jgi:hypothetical protein
MNLRKYPAWSQSWEPGKNWKPQFCFTCRLRVLPDAQDSRHLKIVLGENNDSVAVYFSITGF